MRRSDRLARLEELLARVQRNAAERRREVAGISLGRGVQLERSPSEPPPAPVLRADREPIPPPRLRDELASDPDDWSSLLTRELADPNPLADVSEETSFPSLVPPEPEVAAISEPTPLQAREEPIEPAPESQFEHAMRIAAEQRPQAPDPRALWLDAAEELRERRITLPPEEEPEVESSPIVTTPPATTTPIPSSRRSVRPVANDAHGDTPAPIATFETTHLNAPRAHESVAPPPMSRRRRALRPSPTPIVMGQLPVEKPTPYWAVILLGCGVGLLFTLAYVAFRALDAPRVVGQAVPNTTLTTRRNVEVTPSGEATPSVAPTLASVVPHASHASASSEPPPPPQIMRPNTMGLLWVDAPSPVTVYVQGLPVGEDGAYLEVTCGLKNVRLARRDLPPPGHSFPMWLGKAEPVLVPCGAANRVRMSSE